MIFCVAYACQCFAVNMPFREVETLGGYGAGSDARDADGRPAGWPSFVRGVACGGGFTLAVTNGGRVSNALHILRT